MPRVTLVRSAHVDGTVIDPDSGTVLRVGQTVVVSAAVAKRLVTTRALGEDIRVENAKPDVAEADVPQENDPPAPATADAPPAPAPPA